MMTPLLACMGFNHQNLFNSTSAQESTSKEGYAWQPFMKKLIFKDDEQISVLFSRSSLFSTTAGLTSLADIARTRT